MKSRIDIPRFHGCVPFRIVTTLWLHLRAEQLARENNRADMRLLLGDRRREDTDEEVAPLVYPAQQRALIDNYSGITTLP